ncbi:MAG: DNA replication/repair protein RecF [Spirochaetales bacterium]
MAFCSIRLYNFRNLANATVPTDAKQVFLIGKNGQGKTNFLEAMYYACYASSFRTRRDDVLKAHETEEMAVEATFYHDEDQEDLRSVLIKQRGKRKEIELDGTSVSDRKEIVANIPCVVFCHDDIAFVTGAPDMQRWFMNQTQALIDPSVVTDLRNYTKVLKSRNAALKANQRSVIDVLDQQMAEFGVRIQAKRAALVDALAPSVTSLFSEIFDQNVKIELDYRPSWDEGVTPDDAYMLLEKNRDRDLDLGTSSSGPHRDKYPMRLDGAPLTEVASTGQLRLVSLLLRVAQANLLSELGGRKPVLLLDDVLLELDPTRRKRFVEALPAFDQVFFTFLPDEQYSRLENADTLRYTVSGGTIAQG